jgi:hypothetical protein
MTRKKLVRRVRRMRELYAEFENHALETTDLEKKLYYRKAAYHVIVAVCFLLDANPKK